MRTYLKMFSGCNHYLPSLLTLLIVFSHHFTFSLLIRVIGKGYLLQNNFSNYIQAYTFMQPGLT